MSQSNNDKKFKMTKEELDKFEKALKDEEFRKLLVEYAKEISDPENKKKYEEEITQMEKMRGVDVKFVNPEDGYVVKTTDSISGVKAFVNICSNQHIGKASSQYMEKEENGKKRGGQQWNIPYSLSHPRDDFDRAGNKCVVYDAVFHPDTYQKGQQDKRFKQLMIDTALDGIQKEFKATLERKNLKFPKMKFKGVKKATVIRTKTAEAPVDSADFTIGGQKFPYPYSVEPAADCKEENKRATKIDAEKKQKGTSDPSVPEYKIVHRGHIDLQNFTYARDSKANTRPKELVIYIDLPKLESAAPVDLDILEKQLVLDCKKPPYHLDLALPYPVEEENGSAKFDKSKRRLIVTLPVLPPPILSVQTPVDEETDSEKLSDTQQGEHKSEEILNSQTVAESSSPSSDELVKQDGVTMEGKNTFDVPCSEENSQLQPEDTKKLTDNSSIGFNLSNSCSEFPSPCFFTCPPYKYHQDADLITFIIYVANVALDSISLGFNKNKAYISFPSGTPHSGELPSPDYALYLQFPDDHNLDTELCNIDVSEENIVLTLYKLEACKGLWDSFHAGFSEENLEVKFFITDETVNLMIREIADQDPWLAPEGEASVKVSSLTDECLELEVETNLKESTDKKSFENNEESADTCHMGENISSCEEVNTELTDDQQKDKVEFGSTELKEASREMYEEKQGCKGSDLEIKDGGEGLEEKHDNFVPIDVISNAVRTRRSILRRTSSTSTDESLGDDNEVNGIPESPSKKNVRFNLNPNVRVFSNKKDKKKRKLEARLEAEARKNSLESEGSGSELSNGSSPVNEGNGWGGFRDHSYGEGVGPAAPEVMKDKGESEEVSKTNVHDNENAKPATLSASAGDSFGLTNNLIFELDD